MTSLLPPASWGEVLTGDAPLVGARCDRTARRGRFSPVEARVHLGIPYGDLAREEAGYLARRSLRADCGIVLRAVATRLLATPKDAVPHRRPFVVSAHVDNLRIEEAVAAIVEPHDAPRARLIHFVHPHALNQAVLHADHRARLERAAFVLPDGVGLRLASRLLGTPLAHNINGTDLLPLLCRAAARERRPMVLIGGAPGVAERARSALQAAHPGLNLPFCSDGFLSAARRDEVLAQLTRLGPCLVLVGMGSPVQERFAHDHLAHLPRSTVVTVGGLFDFYAGCVPRAPVLWRELGLEWLFRLAQEPRRLAGRYLLGNPLFLALALKQHLVGRR